LPLSVVSVLSRRTLLTESSGRPPAGQRYPAVRGGGGFPPC